MPLVFLVPNLDEDQLGFLQVSTGFPSASGFSWQLMPHSHCLAVSWLLAELVGHLSLVIVRLTDFVHVVMGLGFPRALEAEVQNTHSITFSQSNSQGQPDGFKSQGKKPLFMGRATKYCGQPSSASGSRQASNLTSGLRANHVGPHLDSVLWPLPLPSYPYKHVAMEEP